MCNCFDDILSKIKESITNQLSEEDIVEGSLSIDWKNRVFFLQGKQNAPVSLYVETEYRPKKKNGDPAKSMRKFDTGVKMSNCPFCGTKYED